VFAAVLYSNRAAAHQGLSARTDAMADCARARALDPTYVRATTRLAMLLQVCVCLFACVCVSVCYVCGCLCALDSTYVRATTRLATLLQVCVCVCLRVCV